MLFGPSSHQHCETNEILQELFNVNVLLEQQKKDEGEWMHPPVGERDSKGETYEPKIVVK